jgi:PEP-CTERM motif
MEIAVNTQQIRSALLGLVAATAVSSAAMAAPCVSGSIGGYLTANNGGSAPSGFSCTVGDKSFSGFVFNSTAMGSGSAVTPSEFSVLPNVSMFGPGFVFSTSALIVNQPVAGPASDVDVTLGYDVTAGPGFLINDAANAIAGGTMGAGFGSADETLSFPSGPGIQLNAVLGGNSSVTATFTPVASLGVLKDILVAVPAGETGMANITAIQQHFSEITITPEPTTLAVLGVGLLGLSVARRRRRG